MPCKPMLEILDAAPASWSIQPNLPLLRAVRRDRTTKIWAL